MLSKPSLKEIKKDLGKLRKYEVVVYGSYARQEFGPRSDIDLAIITREKTKNKNKEIWHKLLGQVPEKYDLKVFELLPLNHEIPPFFEWWLALLTTY